MTDEDWADLVDEGDKPKASTTKEAIPATPAVPAAASSKAPPPGFERQEDQAAQPASSKPPAASAPADTKVQTLLTYRRLKVVICTLSLAKRRDDHQT